MPGSNWAGRNNPGRYSEASGCYDQGKPFVFLYPDFDGVERSIEVFPGIEAGRHAASPPPAAKGSAAKSFQHHRRLFALLFGINTLNYADRYTLPAVAPLLAVSIGLNDTQLGLLGTAFLLIYAVGALPLGALADRVPRTKIVGGGVAFWSVATAVTALCRTFPQLFAVRALLGIGEASYFPASNSMLADAFPQGRRARIMAWWGVALPAGVFLGYAAGGLIGQHFGWRAAFLVVGIPGLILAMLVWRAHEPQRGESEGLLVEAKGSNGDPFAFHLLRIPTVSFAIATEVFAYFVLGGLGFWLTTYLVRHYHLSTGSAGVIAGALFVIGGGIGTVVGGYLADHLLSRQPAARLLIPALGLIASAVAIAGGLLAPSLPFFLVIYTLAGALVSLQSAPLSALFQDVVAPAVRARVVALSLLIAHLFGDAFSPSVIGAASDHLGGTTGGGLDRALWLTPAAAIIAGGIALVGCRYVAADRARMLQHLAQEG
jgi:MFS transporter, Spinster family, sphingosine-1-phosphate transporter